MVARLPPFIIAFLAALVLRSAVADSAPPFVNPPNESRVVTLAGNTRPEAVPANDRGLVPDGMPLAHLQLLLRRPAAREEALEGTITALHDSASPLFHNWLSARELGARFGPDRRDVNIVEKWLASHGFVVEGTS